MAYHRLAGSMARGTLVTGLVVLVCLTMMMNSALVVAGDPPPQDGSAVTISDDTDWSGNMVLDGMVTVAAGATLRIDGNLSIANGTSIVINGGVVLENAALSSQYPPSDLEMWAGYGDEATLFVPEQFGLFTITIFSSTDYNLSNFTVRWNEGPNEDMSGDSHTITAGVVSGGGGTLYFNQNVGEYGQLVVDRIEVNRATTTNVYEAADLDNENWLLRGSAGFSLHISEGGTLVAIDSEMNGADVTINGAFSSTSTDINTSGPLILAGESASITMSGGSFSGSREDHDIKADALAEISLSEVDGSGGIIDLWERQVEEQTLHFPGSGITFNLTGVGPQEKTLFGHSMVDGSYIVPANYQQGPRIVEIGYANGTVWSEDARISDVEWFTAWGTYYGANNSLEKSSDVEVLFPILPDVSVTGISLEKAASVGKRAEVRVTITNNGLAAASVPLECHVGEVRADISPPYPAALLGVGETATIDLKWGVPSSGNHTLRCMPMTPSQVVVNGTLGGGDSTLTTEWSTAAEVSEGDSALLISFIVALVVGLGLVVYFTATRDKDASPKTITISREVINHLDEDLDDL